MRLINEVFDSCLLQSIPAEKEGGTILPFYLVDIRLLDLTNFPLLAVVLPKFNDDLVAYGKGGHKNLHGGITLVGSLVTQVNHQERPKAGTP